MATPSEISQVALGDAGRESEITQRLADYAANVAFGDVPGPVIEKAKLLLRDGIGNQLAASATAEPARVAHGLIASFGGVQQATVTGYGTRLPVPWAALLNAMLGHGVELDDAHGRALAKSGSVLVPTVMSVGEYRHRTGEETLLALIVGYDVMVRIGVAINPGHRQRGFHTTGAVGAMASAVAAAKQLGLDRSAIADALGLGAMQAAGIQAYLDFPCMAKPFSPGKAAMNGTLAALLADTGFTGPRRGLESTEGFFNAYCDQVETEGIVDGLGEDFKIMEVGFKPHAACRYAHGAIDAAQELRRGNSFVIADVDRVSVRMSELAIRQSGRSEVPNLNAAMGSTPFGVALALASGVNGLADYDAGFKDGQIHKLASGIELIATPEFGVAGRQSVVRVTLRDGRVLAKAVDGPRGEPENPLSQQELDEKFMGLATMALSAKRAKELDERLADFDTVKDVAEIASLLNSRHQ